MGLPVGFGARVAVIAALSACVAAAAFALAFVGLSLCTPTAPPGDTAWYRGYLAQHAALLLFGQIAAECPLGVPDGRTLLTVTTILRDLVVVLPLTALGWELLGWPLRLQFLRRRGGHAILVGASSETLDMAPPGTPRLWLLPPDLPPARTGSALARLRRLWRHALPLTAALVERDRPAPLGLDRATLIVAAAQDDMTNFRLARSALTQGFSGRLLARIEAPGLRSLGAEVLRPLAESTTARLTLVAPRVVQAREALARARPGRYLDETAGGIVHLALCGEGPQIDDLTALLARQGYGLERMKPRLSVLRLTELTGSQPTDRPDWADDLLDLTELTVNSDAADTAERIDSAIARIATHPLRLSAIFCTARTPGLAVLLAERWGRALCDLGLPVPPLLALDDAGPHAHGPDVPGFVEVVPLPPLTRVEADETRLDLWAKALHANYLALIAASGAPSLPSHRPWATLPERYREDSRAASDHLIYKLTRLGIALRPATPGPPLALLPDEVEALAPVEHARWVAARKVAGWTKGPRNDAALTHPDILPYNDLDEAGRDKDRDQVARLPGIVAIAGKGLARERSLRLGDDFSRAQNVAAALSAFASRNRDEVPVLWGSLAPQDLAGLAVAQAAGHLTALLLGPDLEAEEWTPAALAVRQGAYRIRVTADPAAALSALPPLLPHAPKGEHA